MKKEELHLCFSAARYDIPLADKRLAAGIDVKIHTHLLALFDNVIQCWHH